MPEDNKLEAHVFNHDADKGDDSGVGAIVKAFIRNPGGALQIVAFIGGIYGVYYAIQGEITDVKAAQVSNFEKLSAGMSQIAANELDERGKIEAMYTRGDTRYTNIIAKLSAHDVDIAKIVSSMDFLVSQYKDSGKVPHVNVTPSPALP